MKPHILCHTCNKWMFGWRFSAVCVMVIALLAFDSGYTHTRLQDYKLTYGE